jgi:hypothetical protein
MEGIYYKSRTFVMNIRPQIFPFGYVMSLIAKGYLYTAPGISEYNIM